ncbi:serine/threonine-protein kinase [Parasphingopyxis sp.]|uniref:serine/threonine protein kinase n=1 Tax=Parasphingopyxis sp. TaxID=1920299 RepID=UPI00262E1187|nr:serine/threonine-protein kinase [Parasphingopyxis sp.]
MGQDDLSLEQRALALLERLLALPENEREQWLQDNRPDDPEVETRVRTLLASADAGDAIETGGAGRMYTWDNPPERVGAYAVEEQIGEGGMGAVFRGRRDAGDFDHEVAIKLIRPGALSDSLIERFERERQILAGLSHPHIARLYDGGTSDDGNPYIIMEYIEGMPIVKWVDAEGLELDARMALFEQVCEAVRFAHQNLIVHRDLTPSNVLVTPEGQPKLIDFGIAKPPEPDTQQDDSGKGSLTGLSLTPGFAAPERLAGAPTTTLSDIYSLGKILNLLVPRWSGNADLAAMIAKATETEPEDRYLSTDALLDDVQRFRSDRPIAARKGGRGYLLGKFYQRNKVSVLAGMAALVVLIGALIGTVYAYNQAERERIRAESSFAATRAIANTMLFDVYDAVDAVPGSTAARELLASTAQSYLDTLSRDPDAPADVRLEVGRGYMRLADVMGGVGGGTLGQREEAMENYRRADEILTALLEEDPDNEAVALALAEARISRSNVTVMFTDEYDVGRDYATSARSILDRQCAAADDCVLQRARTHISEGHNLYWNEEPAEAVAAADRAIEELDRGSEVFRASEQAVRARASAYRIKGDALYYLDDVEGSVRELGVASQLLRDGIASGLDSVDMQRDLAVVEWTRGGSLDEAGMQTEAIEALNRSYRISQRLVEADSDDRGGFRFLAVVGGQRALTLSSAGRYPEAIEGANASLAVRRQLSQEQPDEVGFFRDVAIQLNGLGDIYARAGQAGQACRYYRETIAQFDALDARWGMSDFDRNDTYARAQEALQNC